MLEVVIRSICDSMAGELTDDQIRKLKNTMYMHLHRFTLTEEKNEIAVRDTENEMLMREYIVARRIDGLADGTLLDYRLEITAMLREINKPVKEITKYDMRAYVARLKEIRHLKETTINNRKRYLNGFFEWLVQEDYIQKNPVSGIKALKEDKILKEAYSTEDMEKLRNNCTGYRDRAILEFLYGTGVRIHEMVALKRSDIDFGSREVTVFGKGRKERKVYLSEKACYYLKMYFLNRKDTCENLFATSFRIGTKGVSIAGVQYMLHELGKRAGVKKVHPHRFRRTLATDLLKMGMRIEYVMALLGHEKMDTTLIYARINTDAVKSSYMLLAA